MTPVSFALVPQSVHRRAARSLWTRRRSGAAAAFAAFVCGWLAFTASADAQERAGWELTATTSPTNLEPGGHAGTITLDVFNVGAAASKGEVTVTDTLPAGITARTAGELLQGKQEGLSPRIGHLRWDCSGNTTSGAVEGATVVTCINDPEGLPEILGGGGAPSDDESRANILPAIGIAVNAGPAGTGLVNRATISGGGALQATTVTTPLTVSTESPPFGFARADAWLTNEDGTPDTLAGSHPYEAVVAFDLTTVPDQTAGEDVPSGGEPRHLEAVLPPGLIADATAVSQCTRAQLATEHCPQASIVGVDSPYFASGVAKASLVFNMVPPPGVPVQFGLTIGGIFVFINANVKTGADYGAIARTQIPQRVLVKNILTLWNVPGERSHDPWRNGDFGGCSEEQIENAGTSEESYCVAPDFPSLKPLLTVPTSCGQEAALTLRTDDWQSPATSEITTQMHDDNGLPSTFGGCEELGFEPQIATAAETADADTPTGLSTEVKPSLGGLQQNRLRGTADIKHATVTLPEGFVVNPGRAAGLQACQENAAQSAIGTEEPAHCPAAAKLGTARIRTPLLEAAEEKELEGTVYILQSDPPTLHLLVAASADGVNLKLVGITHLNETTGRIEATFGEDPRVEAEDPFLQGHMGLPPLPFSSFKLLLDGGANSSLDTPTQCGTYTTRADFLPWASPFIAELSTAASVNIDTGPGGGACPSGTLQFAPTLTAGTTSSSAGAFTSFSLLLQRGDGQQRPEKLQFKAPPGLTAVLSHVPLCPEPQATQGTCSSNSQIGHASVASGPGAQPLVLPQPGAPELPIYLTGPYQGAPFGLSIVTPIVAGPFNLGTIITRAKIEIDPTTAQVTVTTDPLPQIVKGVPTDLRQISSTIDRPAFMINPTNCSPLSFSGTAWGTPPPGAGGATAIAALSSPFQADSCAGLKFQPKFTASTSAHTSKTQGASLTTKLTYPAGPQGAQAEIAKVKVELPQQLPSQLRTLQKACIDKVFEANPANCPPESIVGHAIVHTQVLPVPLTGAAYFVSHGGEAFPSLTMLLHGYGVTIKLVGTTLIRKGITSTTFTTVPDVPFETFELVLPQGKYAALGAFVPESANGSLCGQNLKMPTEMIAQNGLEIHQSTPVTVTGCPSKLSVRSHTLHKRTLTLSVYVPSAGKLRAFGKHLSSSSKATKGQEIVTLTLHAKQPRRFNAHLKLTFKPAKGKTQAVSTAAKA